MSNVRSEAVMSTENADAESDGEGFEIEVFKSQVVTIASCSFTEDKSSVENIRYKSCGDPTGLLPNKVTAVVEANDSKKESSVAGSTVEHKARRFKRISLPQWLLKPSRKASHSSSRIRRVSGAGKHRIMRINSAPTKSFAPPSGNGNNFAHCDESKFHIFHKTKEKEHEAANQQTKETRKMRRISLPAHVLDMSGSMMAKRLADAPMPRTPDPKRKNLAELDEKFIQSLQIKGPQFTSSMTTTKRASGGENIAVNGGQLSSASHAENHEAEAKPASTRDTREVLTQFKNARKENPVSSNPHDNARPLSRPVLKLHRFHNPDIFYVPLPDDETQSTDNLSYKLCRARLIEPRSENYMIQECVKEELQDFLQDKQFCSQSCQRWCLELSQSIKTTVHRLKDCQSKIACIVYIGALRGHGVHAAAQCIWTPNDDNFITVNFRNRSMIAVASVLAIKYV